MRDKIAFKIEKMVSTLFVLLNLYNHTLKIILLPSYIFFMSPVYNVTFGDYVDFDMTVKLNTDPYPLCSWLPAQPFNNKLEYAYISYNKLNLLRMVSMTNEDCYMKVHYEIIDVKDDSLHRKRVRKLI